MKLVLKESITLERWRNKAKKLKLVYADMNDISEDALKKIGKDYFYLSSLPAAKIVYINPFNVIEGGKDDDRVHTSRDALFYYGSDDGCYKKMDTKKLIDELAKNLAPYVNPEELIKDALYDTGPDQLKEMYERVIEKKGSVKEKPGCYKLLIGGKRGLPIEFMLRD